MRVLAIEPGLPGDIRQAVSEQAKRILAAPRGRPFFVEFAGMPRAGKSSTITHTVECLQTLGFRIYAPAEGASQAPEYIKRKDLVAYNLWTTCYALTVILEGLHVRNPDLYDVVVLDRGLFDALCWIEYLEDGGKIDEGERKRIADFLRIDNWNGMIDLVFVFTCDAETAKKRNEKYQLIPRLGIVTNEDELRKLHDGYMSNGECYEEDFKQVVQVDTSGNPEVKNVCYSVLREILTGIEANRGEG